MTRPDDEEWVGVPPWCASMLRAGAVVLLVMVVVGCLFWMVGALRASP